MIVLKSKDKILILCYDILRNGESKTSRQLSNQLIDYKMSGNSPTSFKIAQILKRDLRFKMNEDKEWYIPKKYRLNYPEIIRKKYGNKITYKLINNDRIIKTSKYKYKLDNLVCGIYFNLKYEAI